VAPPRERKGKAVTSGRCDDPQVPGRMYMRYDWGTGNFQARMRGMEYTAFPLTRPRPFASFVPSGRGNGLSATETFSMAPTDTDSAALTGRKWHFGVC
jgi:hypothetical protein